VGGLVVTALWLWMARANGQGRNGARIFSTVLFGLVTLALATALGLGDPGHVTGMTVPRLILDQEGPLRGAGSGAPRAGLCLGGPPARPRRRSLWRRC
jgi:hypothetical protein